MQTILRKCSLGGKIMIRILIVEDEITIARLIDLNLSACGYECTCEYDGLAAADLLEQMSFDLILLDIMLPGADGFELMDLIRPTKTPVIFLTARGDLASKVHGLQGGAEDYIVKPFEMLELLVRVENVLKRHRPAEDVLRIRDVEIFPKERIVKKNEVEIPFKPMEFDCLLLLCKYKNIAISRQQLLHALWGVDFEGETRTIDVHIARIRKKLDFQNVIKTIPRIGYRLEDHS